MPNLMFLVVFAAASLTCFYGVVAEMPTLVFVSKPLPALALLFWVATSANSETKRHPIVYRAVLAALLFSVAGDVILELDKRYFIFGLGSFLVAHVFYIVAFVAPKSGRDRKLLAAIPFLAWTVSMGIFIWPGLQEKGMTIPVVIYMAVITLMMWRAAARANDRPTLSQWACIVGAIIFGLSDSLIALRDFHAPFDWAKLGILSTYWLGQLGLATSFVLEDKTPTQPR